MLEALELEFEELLLEALELEFEELLLEEFELEFDELLLEEFELEFDELLLEEFELEFDELLFEEFELEFEELLFEEFELEFEELLLEELDEPRRSRFGLLALRLTRCATSIALPASGADVLLPPSASFKLSGCGAACAPPSDTTAAAIVASVEIVNFFI